MFQILNGQRKKHVLAVQKQMTISPGVLPEANVRIRGSIPNKPPLPNKHLLVLSHPDLVRSGGCPVVQNPPGGRPKIEL